MAFSDTTDGGINNQHLNVKNISKQNGLGYYSTLLLIY